MTLDLTAAYTFDLQVNYSTGAANTFSLKTLTLEVIG